MSESRPRSLLLLVTKNTSALDYALPLLWQIKHRFPDIRVAVLYGVLSQRKILRDFQFYSKQFRLACIPEYDLAEFLPPPYSVARGLWRQLCSVSDWDTLPLEHGPWLPLARLIGRGWRALRRRLDGFLLEQIRPDAIWAALAPDVILLDHRTNNAFFGRDQFEAYVTRFGKKVVLLPHAPHHTGTTTFTPFAVVGDPLPAFCDYWMPFVHDQCWLNLPDKRGQFAYVGYPGMDQVWLEHALEAGPRHSAGALRCLFIIRKFLAKGGTRPPGHDAYVYDYAEFSAFIESVADVLAQADVPIDVIVKPHPSNDFHMLTRTLGESPLRNWRIGADSVYAFLTDCDFVISLYSTTLLIPAIAGIPVIVLGSRVQQEIQQWPELKQLYTGLRWYCENAEELSTRLPEVLALAQSRRAGRVAMQEDVTHLRRFFPDGALERTLARLGL